MSLSSKNQMSKAQLEEPSVFSANKHELSVKLPYGSSQNNQTIVKSSPSMLGESKMLGSKGVNNSNSNAEREESAGGGRRDSAQDPGLTPRSLVRRMDTNDELLVSAREKEAARAANGGW